MQLTAQLERALARITAYRQRAPLADHASHYEERSRARPPVLSPLPLKANTETSDEMCFTVMATPTNRAGIVSRGVASRLTISTAAPWSKTPSKNCGTQRKSNTPLASIEVHVPCVCEHAPGSKIGFRTPCNSSAQSESGSYQTVVAGDGVTHTSVTGDDSVQSGLKLLNNGVSGMGSTELKDGVSGDDRAFRSAGDPGDSCTSNDSGDAGASSSIGSSLPIQREQTAEQHNV